LFTFSNGLIFIKLRVGHTVNTYWTSGLNLHRQPVLCRRLFPPNRSAGSL